ncbi:MFS transporter [Marinitenerispora sediminis]|uniref:MFS transporter n=1 Tax=Marinitenerispora sediminis TaxID=1931232 RepID=A0A368T232_9ACTN|nr:MFS transporter [Marinitenerispora sediminis]RCV49784.1 MFS transporter [Marinitenerispora sediminis]RCV50199.1 MFS transporter [Marinitenerispora sediminis]RCV55208.1 MFS transporter [Marinitenerispora sediminis]
MRPRRLVAGVMLGTLLNALNSSMIALALVPIARHYGTGLATAVWLVSGFYLAATVCLPLMGRLADRFGPRRVFVSGLALVCATCALAPLAPNMGVLIAARVLLAVGTSVAFPSAMAVLRAALPGGPPQSALAMIAAANSASAAFGPVIGGVLVQTWGWQAIWLVNVPVTLAGIALALALLPKAPPSAAEPGPGALAGLDLPGIAAFVLAMGGLIGFLLSVAAAPEWVLLPLAAAGAAALVRRELRTAHPFLDLRMLGANRRLLGVFAQNAAVNVVFYLGFIGLPQWLQAARGDSAGAAGLAVLPIAGVGVLAMPLVTRLLRRNGEGVVLTVGSLALLAGSLGLLLAHADTPLLLLLPLTLLLGVPNAFNNLGLQSAMYRAAPGEQIGVAAGLFQTFRYVGSIGASVVVGVVFTHEVTDAGLRQIALVMAAVSAVLVVVSARGARGAAAPPDR